MKRILHIAAFLLFSAPFLSPSEAGIGKPWPSHINVRYGPYKRNVLDLWLPESERPTALVLYFHGGGFKQGGKLQISGNHVRKALDNGVAIASVQYRLVHRNDRSDRHRTGIQYALRDAARALQYLRYHADTYGIDKTRIASFGHSAGAGTSLWLATHDDLADPNNPDPVLRESSRLIAAGLIHGQFSYDITKWEKEFEERFGEHIIFFGGANDPSPFYDLSPEEFAGEEGAKWRADVDMRELLSPDDPPVIMVCRTRDRPPISTVGFAHHPLHAILLEERCREVGVQMFCITPHIETEDAAHLKEDSNAVLTFLIRQLNESQATPPEAVESVPVTILTNSGEPEGSTPATVTITPDSADPGAPVPSVRAKPLNRTD